MQTIASPLEGATFSLPLPLYDMRQVGSLVGDDGEAFSILIGLDQTLVEQLREKSLADDSAIQNNTSDRLRFGEGSYEEWYAKERTPFALVHTATNALAALVFFGPKPLARKPLKYLSPDERAKELSQEKSEWHTVAFRSYPPFRGKKLMKPFARFAIDHYLAAVPGSKIWAGIDTTNPASVALTKGLGFVAAPEVSDDERAIFILE